MIRSEQGEIHRPLRRVVHRETSSLGWLVLPALALYPHLSVVSESGNPSSLRKFSAPRRIERFPIDSGTVNASQPSRPIPGVCGLRMTVVAAFLIVVAACSSDPELTTESAQPETESSTASTVETATSSTVVELERFDSLASGDTVDPGRWATSTLATPVSFEVAAPFVLLEEIERLVAIGTPEPGISSAAHALVLLNPAGVVVFDGSQPAEAPFPSDLGRWFDENPAIEIIDSGTVPGGAWWDIATSENTSISTPCQFGDRCVEWLVLANGTVSVVADQETWRFRVFELDPIGDEPLVMMVQAPIGSFDDLVGLGETVVSSLKAEQRSQFPETETPADSLAAIVDREPLPPGDYSQDLRGIGVLHLNTDAPLDVVVGDVREADVAFFDTLDGPPSAFVIFTDDPLVDPADTAAPGVDYGTTTERNIASWAELVDGVTVEDQGEGSIGGQAVDWWDLGIDPSAPDDATTPCDFDPSRRCVHLVEEGDKVLDVVEGSTARVHVFRDLPLKLFVKSNGVVPEAPTLEAILTHFEPVFDGLTIEP